MTDHTAILFDLLQELNTVVSGHAIRTGEELQYETREGVTKDMRDLLNDYVARATGKDEVVDEVPHSIFAPVAATNHVALGGVV